MSTASTTTSAPVLTAEMFEQERAKLAKDATQTVVSETPAHLDSLGTRPSGTTPAWNGLDGTREGRASDNELTETQRQAMQEAVRTLAPYVDHPAIGGLVGKMQSIADEPEPRHPGDGDGDTLADELSKVEAVRTQIAKGEVHASPEMRERFDKAAANLQDAYLRRVSPGHERAELQKAHDRSLQRVPSVV